MTWRHQVKVPRFWLAIFVIADLVVIAPVSLAGSILALAVVAVVVKFDPRAPLLVGAGVVASLPVLVAFGGATEVDVYATMAIALIAISVVLLARAERRRLR
jgi:4-amino-4-deoxy-L-arabinose transferase-like glycosyltransferase